ncbi:hypothetical protein C8R44DRAFT_800331 [Mycena epipterygia]|nr:hypothetical protein C8R44DRAFT_800331 [Mycena epipterygia]
MEPRSSQLAQELVDHIIDFLHDSQDDLAACALVSRSWTYAAQSQIFQRIAFGLSIQAENARMWARFQGISNASPHLIRYVRRLHVSALREQLSAETFLAICNFPFTNLDGAFVSCHSLTLSSALALQQLLSLPTLRREHIKCYRTEPMVFLQIWDRCALSLRHLELGSRPEISDALLSTQNCSAPIRLESLRIRRNFDRWLTHSLCPFDFSRLKLLSTFSVDPAILQSPNFSSAHRTIEVLDVAVYSDKPIDLSSFPSLTLLRISAFAATSLPTILDTLSSIAPANRILKIVLSFMLDPAVPFEQLDSRLSCLPLHHSAVIEFGTSPDHYARLITNLPRLSSQNVLRRTDFDAHCSRGRWTYNDDFPENSLEI